MFLRRYHRTVAGKSITYFALVESVRTEAGPRQQVVAYLGELNDDQQRRWHRTITFHNRQGEAQQLRLFPDDNLPLPDDPDVVRIRLSSVGWTNSRSFGDVWLAWQLWRFLHLDDILAGHLPQGQHTARPADIVAIEVINRLCGPCSEFALAEHWYSSTGLEDLLGIPDQEITKDRLYRTLDALIAQKPAIENQLKEQWGLLFQLEYNLLLYDLTSTYFEGLAEDNDLARRGHSRDHRRDCKQVILALIVTRDGFPLAHFTLAGNTSDVKTVKTVITEVEQRFGTVQRIWVMDRGMISNQVLTFLNRSGRKYLLATRRSELASFQEQLSGGKWQSLEGHPDIVVKLIKRRRVIYLLARSPQRRQKERAIRRRQRRALAQGLRQLQKNIASGRLKSRDKVLERVGRLKGKYPKGTPFVTVTVSKRKRLTMQVSWEKDKFRAALARDGAYLLRSNQSGWTATEFWETYMQLTVVEHAFRVLKSYLLLRPIWHHYSGRVEAHVFICVLAYGLYKTLDHLAKQAGLQTEIRKPDPKRPNASPKVRPMTPEVIIRGLGKIKIGDIHMETTTGQQLVLRRVGRPDAEQKKILAALPFELPERLGPDHLL